MPDSLIKETGLTSQELYAEINLPGNLPVRIYDHTRIYFGDYYHVRLAVTCVLPLPLNSVNCADESGELPVITVYNRFLERMAVPSAAVEDVRLELLTEFRQNSLHYLTAADFPAKLARTVVKQTGASKRYAASS